MSPALVIADITNAASNAAQQASGSSLWLPPWLYNGLKDLGGVGAIVALVTGIVAAVASFATVQLQLGAEARSRRQERAVAASLLDAMLIAFEFDLDTASNTFDPGGDDEAFLNSTILPERATFLRGRLRPPPLKLLLPYVAKVGHAEAREFVLIKAICQRARDDRRSITPGELRALIRAMRKRSVDLRAALGLLLDVR